MRTFSFRGSLRLAAIGVLCVAPRGAGAQPQPQPAAEDVAGTRLIGVQIGPHPVGFEVRIGIDRTRRINATDGGTKIGLAIWHPAQQSTTHARISSLDYRLLEFSQPPSAIEKARYADGEADVALAWPHVGIVPLTRPQALAALASTGIAVRDAPWAAGTFPLVLVFGGQYYLSTTAEVLASYGFVTVAPFRFRDQSNEIGTERFTSYVENSVRDAEWALTELAADGRIDVTQVSLLGHGGGGLQALLFAMRNRSVSALVNVDAGNFSSRSSTGEIPFYSPRAVRAPYLFIATAETKAGQNLFDQFVGMRFSDRLEVVLQQPGLRHHDLSDIGRAVTAPLALRGEHQAAVQRTYAAVQQMIVGFLDAHAARRRDRASDYVEWLRQGSPAGSYVVTAYAGATPAPTVAAVIASLDAATAARLAAARREDPDAPLFQPDSLEQIIWKAIATRQFAIAVAVADFALTLHPASAVLQDYRSEGLEAAGDIVRSMEAAAACAELPAADDWRITGAIARCRARAERLRGPGVRSRFPTRRDLR